MTPIERSPILVTGATGTLGSLVLRRLRRAGCEVRALSRQSHVITDGVRYVTGDLIEGIGIEDAVDGVKAVVHCASAPKGDGQATQNLIRAIVARKQSPHFVFISIVGADRMSFGYIRSKLEAERMVTESGLPWTILRATQFYDFVLNGAKLLARLPVVPAPAGFLVQPIDPDEVAARLVELALGEPAGRVPDIGGPEVISWADMVRAYLRHVGKRRPVVQVSMPGIKAIREGALLSTTQLTPLGRTWAEFLAERLD